MWRSFCHCNVWSQNVDLQHTWGETPPKWQKIIFDNFVNIIPHSQLYFWRKNYVPLSHHMGRLITMGLFIFVMSPPWLLYKALPFLRRKVHMGLWPSALSYILLVKHEKNVWFLNTVLVTAVSEKEWPLSLCKGNIDLQPWFNHYIVYSQQTGL